MKRGSENPKWRPSRDDCSGRRLAPAAARAALLATAVCAGCARAPVPGEPRQQLERQSRPLSAWRFHVPERPEATGASDLDDLRWEEVRVPHTWGAQRHREAWYSARFTLAPGDLGKRVYLRFEGVATLAEVFVNGALLGRHNGAFTAFVFDATAHTRAGENRIAVKVDNSREDTADSLPSGAGRQLYHLYGGIYRKAWLLLTPALHVDPTDLAASGVYLTARNVSERSADFEARVLVRNSSDERRFLQVRTRVADDTGQQVLSLEGSLALDAGQTGQIVRTGRIDRPRLWGPGHPHLYAVRGEIVVGGSVVDAVEETTGLREIRFDGERFLLNGAPITLRGIGKHQETERNLSAVTDDELRQDFAELGDLGVNLVRLAHYPHARLAYDLADRMGLLVWAENGHSNPYKVAHPVGDVITREMIRQNYNHPSIVIWSIGNETAYTRVRRYTDVARQEDPTRLTAYASNTGALPKEQYPNLDLIAHNTYRGWYRGLAWDFEENALESRFIAENGAGAVVATHTDYAVAHHVVNSFEPEEFRQLMAEVQYQVVFREHAERIPLYSVWILRDFGIDKYKGVNTKGLLTGAGFRKDAYYLYRSFLRPDEPLVHLTSKTYFLRRGDATNGIKAYSNRPRLRLVLNGEDQGERANGEFRHPNDRRVDNVFFWPSRLREGRNEVRASDGAGHEDAAVVYFHGPGGLAPSGGPPPLVAKLTSSNPRAPAFFIDKPVEDQWPFYAEHDGTADNTFDRVPEPARGASWIATPRLSKPETRTELRFRVTAAAEVFVLHTEGGNERLAGAGFADTGWRGEWRDNAMRLVPARLQRRAVASGALVLVPAATADYVVLVRRADRGPASAPASSPAPSAAPASAAPANPTPGGPSR